MMRLLLVAGAAAAWAMALPGTDQQTIYEGEAAGALLLNNGVVAVVAEGRVLLVSPGDTRTAALDGPFARVNRIVHGREGGLVVWDDSVWTAFVFADDGEERSIRFREPGMGGGEVNFLALLPDETGLFEEVDIGNPFALMAGALPPRFPVRYMAVAADDSRNELWAGRGKERSMHRTANGMSSAPVIFGYGVLAAGLAGGRGFVVAQTDGAEAVVIAADGVGLAALPMPPQEPAVTEDEVEAERARLIATSDRSDEAKELDSHMETLLRGRLPEDRIKEMFEGIAAARIEAIRNAPANSLPPRISGLTADRDDRVWMRRFARPGQTVATWNVFPIDGGQGWAVQLPASWTVFDATGDRVLAGVMDESGGVVRVIAAELPRS